MWLLCGIKIVRSFPCPETIHGVKGAAKVSGGKNLSFPSPRIGGGVRGGGRSIWKPR